MLQENITGDDMYNPAKQGAQQNRKVMVTKAHYKKKGLKKIKEGERGAAKQQKVMFLRL